MKNIKQVLCCLVMLLTFVGFSQTFPIKAAEYYIDQDPGAGKGIAIPVTGFVDSLVDISITQTNTDTLSEGIHKVSLRTQDSIGQWSHYAVSFFQVDNDEVNTAGSVRFPIKAAEYYIDQDPGAGKGIAIPVTGFVDSLVEISITQTKTDTLSAGVHKVSLRVQDSIGQWSHYAVSFFQVDNDEVNTAGSVRFPIKAAEYYIDQDPGAGNGIAIPVSGYVDSLVDITLEQPNTDTLSFGIHKVSLRTQDSIGQWSHYAVSFFQVDDPDNIVINSDSLTDFVGFEYYFDTIANVPGNGTYVPFDSALASVEDYELDIPFTSALSVGSHQISVRFKMVNEQWGHYEQIPFEVCLSPTATPTAVVGNTLCKGPATTSVSASGSPTGEYSWYTVSSGGTPLSNSGDDSVYSQHFPETTTLYVASKGGVCNSNRLPVQVDVLNGINKPDISSIIHCGPGAFELTPSGKPEGGTYYWYATDTSTVPFYKGDVYTVAIDTVTTYYVASATGNGACISDDKQNVLVFIKSCKPQAIIFPKPQNVIFGLDKPQALTAYSQDDLGVKTGLPISYEIIEGNTRAFLRNDSVFYKGIGIVKIRATQPGDTNHIYNPASPVVVEFSIQADAAQVAIVHNSPLCAGEGLNLSPTIIKDARYEWSGPNGFISTRRVVNILPITQADSGRYKLQVITPNDTLISSVGVEVKPQAKQVYLQSQEITKCGDKVYEFTATGGVFRSFNWFLNGTGVAITDSVAYTPLFTGVYHVKAIDSNVCSSQSSPVYIDLTPDVLPEVSFNDTKTRLVATTAETYQWYINDLFIADVTTKEIPLVANGIYKVVTTSTEGCTYISRGFDVEKEGLATISLRQGTITLEELRIKDALTVSPNPVSDVLNIQLRFAQPNGVLEIVNSQGQVVKSIVVTNEALQQTINVADLNTGLYVIILTNNTSSYRQNFVVGD